MNGSTVYYDFDKEMEQVAIFLNAESDLLADRLELKIKGMMTSGMGPKEILEVLRRDLREGGQLFSGFNSTFRRNVFPVIDNVAQGAVIRENPKAALWEWITTSAEPCPDCLPRHGVQKVYAEWEKIGLPRSGFSRCGDNCKCALVPAVQVGRSLEDGPVVVDPLAAARADFQARLATDPALQQRMEDYRASVRARRSK